MRTGDTTSIWPGLYSYYAYEYANLLALPLGDQTQVSQRVFFLDMTSRLPLQFGIDCPGPSISLELYASQYPTATVILGLDSTRSVGRTLDLARKMRSTGGLVVSGGGWTCLPTASQGCVRFLPHVRGLATKRTTRVVSSAPSELCAGSDCPGI
jgi:hypothetical protein